MATNWKQLKAIETKNKKRILEICPKSKQERLHGKRGSQEQSGRALESEGAK